MAQPVTSPPDKNNPSFLTQTWDFFHDLIDLKDGLDKEGTIINIKDNKEMKGANAWLLMCSILIASLGLDLNSPAVIIGAMLISPLMAPILGMGLGIGINDQNTLVVSGKHLLIAIGIALVTSTLYFAITNVMGITGGFTSEIQGRTRPSILDAMVALIGGLAGIISSSRKDKSNAIPGVAIATALMPPLCVTGYGLAQGLGYLFGAENINPNFASVIFNSFFLFILNATLVALATYLIVRFMGFPTKSFDSLKEKRKTKLMLYVTSVLLLGVSVFTTYSIITENNTRLEIDKFVNEHKVDLKLVEHEIIKDFQGNHFTIEMDILESLSPAECDELNRLLKEPPYEVQNATIKFNYPDEEKLKAISQKSGENLLLVQADMKALEQQIDSLSNEVDALQKNKRIERENSLRFFARTNFPDLNEVKFFIPLDKNDPASLTLQWDEKTFSIPKIRKEKEEKLKEYVLSVMEVDSIILTYMIN